jgi:hypothetical protein
MFKLLIFLLLVTPLLAGESMRTPAAADKAVSNELSKAETSGAILTHAQIEALVDQNKLKEALKAFFARETKTAAAKDKAKKK